MSSVVKGARGPSHIRAVIHVTLGCVLLGGCSAGSERFASFPFENSFSGAPPAGSAAAPSPGVPDNPSQPAQPASYQPAPGSGLQLTSASAGQPNGYLKVSRVDLPPLPPSSPAPGTKVADGYGPYNRPPLPDGSYAGPRVYTPYDEPRGEAPPPPPAYTPDDRGDGPGQFGRGAPPPPPQGFYRPSGPGPGEARIFEPRPDGGFRDGPPNGEPGPGFGGGPGRGAFAPPQSFGPDRRAFAPPRPFGPDGRDRGEGRSVAVRPGETLYTLARRYGVSAQIIARANGLSSPYVRPGTVVLIPQAGRIAYERPSGGGADPRKLACAGERCHVVKPGETVVSIAHAYRVTGKQIAEANNLTNWAVKPGQTIVIPGGNQSPRQAVASAGRPGGAPPPAGQGSLAPVPGTDPGIAGKAGASQLQTTPQPAPEVKTAQLAPQLLPEPSCEAALANPQPRMGSTFRRPLEGRTIAQFGPQRDGTVNEGVTISVPKGTPIKAAENGVVAYAGNELPGFGNLILIRHADEYVTAYAHADAILVKKCDVVKRGQTVGTAGTSGDAGQPQLHFEIRKNSKPVDPTPLLGS